MAWSFTCTNCEKEIETQILRTGDKKKCPHCGTSVTVSEYSTWVDSRKSRYWALKILAEACEFIGFMCLFGAIFLLTIWRNFDLGIILNNSLTKIAILGLLGFSGLVFLAIGNLLAFLITMLIDIEKNTRRSADALMFFRSR